MTRKRIAILGASADRAKYGNKAVRAYVRAGWEVFPVNPNETQVEGLDAYASLADVPKPLDRVTTYVPPGVGITLLPQIVAAAAKDFLINPGAESAALLAEARRLGLSPRLSCSIIEVGANPGDFPGI